MRDIELEKIRKNWPKFYYFGFVIILILFGFSHDKIIEINATFMTICIFIFMSIWGLMYFIGFDFIKYLYSRYNYFKLYQKMENSFNLNKTKDEKRKWLKFVLNRLDSLEKQSFTALKVIIQNIEELTKFAHSKGED